MSIQAPNIPRPKHEDEDYMKVWHQLIDKELEYYRVSRECNIWRRSFYILVAFDFVTLFLLSFVS